LFFSPCAESWPKAGFFYSHTHAALGLMEVGGMYIIFTGDFSCVCITFLGLL
jgi:hypothetical protein